MLGVGGRTAGYYEEAAPVGRRMPTTSLRDVRADRIDRPDQLRPKRDPRVDRPTLHRQIDLVGESDGEPVDLKLMEIAGHDQRSRLRRDFAPCGLWTVDRGLAIGSAHRRLHPQTDRRDVFDLPRRHEARSRRAWS